MTGFLQFLADGTVTSPQGFLAGGVYAAIKSPGEDKLDLGILYSAEPCTVAGVFTTNKIKAAPVLVGQERVKRGIARAVVVNSGNANACTGEQGMADALEMAAAAAAKLGIPSEEVLPSSTGVIGVPMDMGKIRSGISKVEIGPDGGHALARAIITTDTGPKEVAVIVEAEGVKATIGGIAKGAGMIHPNMATMLSFITTDLGVEAGFLRRALKRTVDNSFNMVTVDGDGSTNDTVLVLANGLAGNAPVTDGSPLAGAFLKGLEAVCAHLAKAIARDGEGATSFIEVTVSSALDLADARVAARTVASSSLVKTAAAGHDPNWGRIMAALGRSGAEVVESKVDLYLNNIPVLKGGALVGSDAKRLQAAMAQPEVEIRIDLNLGKARATAWGCDLTEGYVTFNSAYTT